MSILTNDIYNSDYNSYLFGMHSPNERQRQQSYWQPSSRRTYDASPSPCTKTPKSNRQILCKIAFEIDSEEQQLLIYENTTLDMVTDQLIMKLSFASLANNQSPFEITQEERTLLEEEIKAKIQVILESCIDCSPKTTRWKNKLKDFLHNKEVTPIPPQKNQSQGTLSNEYKSKSIKYFGYNTSKTEIDELDGSTSNLKTLQIIQRGKEVQSTLGRPSRRGLEGYEPNHRLYDLGRRNDVIKQYLSKIREEYLQQQQLNECTFQPNLSKIHLRTEENIHSRITNKPDTDSVFNRLYKQALQKQEKLKIIQRKIQEKEKEEYQHLNFIPSINSCSRDIVSAKKEKQKNNSESIYEHLYNAVHRKEKKEKVGTWAFKPTLCPRSEELAKQSKEKRPKRPMFNNENCQKPKEKSIEKSPNGSQFYSKRATSRKSTGKDKNSSFLKKFQYLYKFDTHSPLKTQKNTHPSQLHNQSTNKESHNRSQHSSISRRAITTDGDVTQPAEFKHKSYKNIVDISVFGTQPSAQSSFKKTKQNLFFLTGNNHPVASDSSYQDTGAHILTERINGTNNRTSIKLNGQQHRQQNKKGKLNPFQFFQQEERKAKTKSTRVKTDAAPVVRGQLKSRELIWNKQKVFEELFDALNVDSLEEIDANTLAQSTIIPANLRNIFTPMAEEMKQLKVGLDKQEFVWSLSRIYDTLTPSQQQGIVSWTRALGHPTPTQLQYGDKHN